MGQWQGQSSAQRGGQAPVPGAPSPARTEGALVPHVKPRLGVLAWFVLFFKNDFQGQQQGEVLSSPALGDGFGARWHLPERPLASATSGCREQGFCEPCWALPPVSAPAGL